MNIIMIFLVIAQCVVLIIWAWVLGVAFVGTCREKVPDKAEVDFQEKLFFAVLICAHNEELVIKGLLESLRVQTYSADYWKVFLIADRCTDGTCDIAEQYDFVTILRREEEGESRKGIALEWGIQRVLKREREKVDAIMVLDADNQVIPEFLELFNKQFLKGSFLITGKRVAMNPYQTLVSKWYAIYWSMVTELFCYSHSQLGLSSLLSGTGFAFSVFLLGQEGFHTTSMSEDIEFSVQQNLKGIRVDYLEEAVFYDEQPIGFKVMLRQLRRWATGGNQIVGRYAGKLIKKFSQKPSLLIWDSLLSLLFCGNMGAALALGIGFGLMGMIRGQAWAIYALVMGSLSGAVVLWIANISVRRSGLDVRKIFGSILLYPAFGLLFSCVALYSFLNPQKKWHKIEHYGVREVGVMNEEGREN